MCIREEVGTAACKWRARTAFPWRLWPRWRFELRACSFARKIQGRDCFFNLIPTAFRSDVTRFFIGSGQARQYRWRSGQCALHEVA
jgi:hypothetical protein